MHVVGAQAYPVVDELSRFPIDQPLGLEPDNVLRQENCRLSESLRH